MAEFTKEQQVQAVYDLKVGYTLGHADIAILKSMARQLLASMEQEPVARRWRWSDDAEGCWRYTEENRETRGSVTAQPLYAAPQLPQPAAWALERLRSIVADPRALPRRKEWISGQQYSYVLLENVEEMVDDACRAAMPQGAESVSQPDEVAVPKQQKSKDGTVTVYPWLVSISSFEKDMRMWIPFTLITHRYDDGLITKEDLHENLREWIKGEIGDNLYTITFFGRMAPYQAPQQETK